MAFRLGVWWPALKKLCQNWTRSNETFWICAWIVLVRYAFSACHLATVLRQFTISSQWSLSSPCESREILSLPSNSSFPILLSCSTVKSRHTDCKLSRGTLKVKASFQTGETTLCFVEVFFFFAFFPSQDNATFT